MLVHGRQGLSGDHDVAHGVGATEARRTCLWWVSHAAVLGGMRRSFHSVAVCYLAGALVGCALGMSGVSGMHGMYEWRARAGPGRVRSVTWRWINRGISPSDVNFGVAERLPFRV